MSKESQFANKSGFGSRAMNSWKEIARHLGRSVRTVQRWEEQHGLPVRRFRSTHATGVMAFVDEIDRWQRTATSIGLPAEKNFTLVLLENVDPDR